MKLNLPYQIRATLYVLTAIGTPFVAYLATVHVIGTLEVAFWSAEVAVVSALAAFNVNKPDEL